MGWLERFVPTPENVRGLFAVESLADQIANGDDAPLVVLHGPPGTGKSHLVQILFERIAPAEHRLLRAREDFELRTPDGAHEVETLVVEDVQYLPKAAYDRFASLLDDRANHGRPTLATASTPPNQLRRRDLPFPARIASRLASGLVVGLTPLGPASRRRLFDAFVARAGLSVPDEIAAWIAETARGARAVESAAANLELLARIHGKLPRPALLREHLETQLDALAPNVERIVGLVAGHFRIPAKDIRSKSRTRSLVTPRHVSMYLARQLTPLSLGQIGAYFSGCDHTTVLHACRKVESSLDADPALSGAVRHLHDELK